MLDRASAAFGHIGIASSAVVSGDVFLYHKTTNRGLYEKAVKDRPEFTDVLLYNEAGEVTESTIANIAVEWDGVLCTPPLRCGLLPGVYRAWMLHQHRLHEKVLHLDEVLASPRVYLMNAVRGIQKVRLMNGPAQDAPSRKMEITG
jgi:para-aminobenzoate synthetase / 4-amino-4-deoxychorismate lyase